MRTGLVTDALEAAARTRAGGWTARSFTAITAPRQYASAGFANACARLGVIQSMGAVGTSADNAAAESFNASLGREPLQAGTLVQPS